MTSAPYVMAYRTDFPVNTYSGSSMRAGPAFLFQIQKPVHTFLFNIVQVFEHAHMVLRPVPFVQLFEPFARILVTVIAKTGNGLSEQCTICYDAPNAVHRLVWSCHPAPMAAVIIPQVGVTYSAIHAARRYQGRLYHLLEVYCMCSCLLLFRFLVNKQTMVSIKEGSSGICR